MFNLEKQFYLTFREFVDATPYVKFTMKSILMFVFDIEDEADLSNYQLPSDLSTNATVYNELMALIYGRYSNEYIVKLIRGYDEADPTEDDFISAVREWGYNFVSKLNLTFEYYAPLLKFYRDNKTNLMNDITSTSKNKIKFNDTPQNANASSVYEGDDYITNFTSTDNESSSELNSKIMRLKEIQDHYKNVMADWVNEFEKLFIERNDV